MHLFEGNKAETTTLIPVLTAFGDRHDITDMVVVADAGMLWAANLNALEDAGFSFIVASRLTKAPYDLAKHVERKGNYSRRRADPRSHAARWEPARPPGPGGSSTSSGSNVTSTTTRPSTP
jgi:Transposase DDE domain